MRQDAKMLFGFAAVAAAIVGWAWTTRPPPEPEARVSALELLTEYVESPVRADIRHRGKRLAVTGYAGEVKREGTAFVELSAYVRDGIVRARCLVDSDQEKALAAIPKNASVVATGEVGRYKTRFSDAFEYVDLEHCSVLIAP